MQVPCTPTSSSKILHHPACAYCQYQHLHFDNFSDNRGILGSLHSHAADHAACMHYIKRIRRRACFMEGSDALQQLEQNCFDKRFIHPLRGVLQRLC